MCLPYNVWLLHMGKLDRVEGQTVHLSPFLGGNDLTKPPCRTWTTSGVNGTGCAVQKKAKSSPLKLGKSEGRQEFNQHLNHISKRWDLLWSREWQHVVKIS